MKPIAVILLTLLMLVQPLSKMLIVAQYQVNKNYIAEVLCVNKSKPELRCEGKCHLSKELAKVNQSESEIPEILHIKAELPFIIQPVLLSFLPEPNPPVKVFAPFRCAAEVTQAYGIFHPPRFLV